VIDGKTTTGLAVYLKARPIQRLFVAGLATDFCVAWSVLDARKAGSETCVIDDACRGIDTQGCLPRRGRICRPPASSAHSVK
jgi:nicotinamidase/pyrazinamidase